MRANKLFRRSKAKDGEGRQVKIKHILVPEEVADELALYRDAYAACLGVRVTYEQMFRRWLENVGRIDHDIPKMAEKIRTDRINNQTSLAEGIGLTLEQMKANEVSFDPTAQKNEPWLLKYYFVREGEQVDASPGKYTPFYATFKGKNIGMSQLLAEGWTLQNEIGDELDFAQAEEIRRQIDICGR